MKNERILKALGHVDDRLIDEAATVFKKEKKIFSSKIKRYTAAACLILTVITVVIFSQNGLLKKQLEHSITDKRYPIKEISNNTSGPEASYIVPKWNEKTLCQQFPAVNYNSSQYSSQNTEIAADKVGAAAGTAALQGHDIYTASSYTANASIYTIQGISPKCAVALKFENNENYYVYVNAYYKPETLGEFITDLNLTENIYFGSAWYSYTSSMIEFPGLEKSIVMKMLLGDPSPEAVDNYDGYNFVNIMSVSVNIPLLGYENISLGVTADGYLTTNILDTGKAFFIGADKTRQFVDYITNNYEGFEIKYVYNHEAVPE